jgi:hypothetical protein
MRDQRVFLWTLSLPVLAGVSILLIVYPVVVYLVLVSCFSALIGLSYYLLGPFAKFNGGVYIMEVNMNMTCAILWPSPVCSVTNFHRHHYLLFTMPIELD